MSLYSLLFLFQGCSDNTSEITEKRPMSMSKQRPFRSFLVEQISKITRKSKFLYITCRRRCSIWNPDATQVLSLQEADLIISNGANFEPFLQKYQLNNKRSLIHPKDSVDSNGRRNALTWKKGAHFMQGSILMYGWIPNPTYSKLKHQRSTHPSRPISRGLYEDGYIKQRTISKNTP